MVNNIISQRRSAVQFLYRLGAVAMGIPAWIGGSALTFLFLDSALSPRTAGVRALTAVTAVAAGTAAALIVILTWRWICGQEKQRSDQPPPVSAYADARDGRGLQPVARPATDGQTNAHRKKGKLYGTTLSNYGEPQASSWSTTARPSTR